MRRYYPHVGLVFPYQLKYSKKKSVTDMLTGPPDGDSLSLWPSSQVILAWLNLALCQPRLTVNAHQHSELLLQLSFSHLESARQSITSPMRDDIRSSLTHSEILVCQCQSLTFKIAHCPQVFFPSF